MKHLHLHPNATTTAGNPYGLGCACSARVVALLFLAVAFVFSPHRSHAQSGAAAVAQRLSLTPHAARAPLLPFVWPMRFADRKDLGPMPIFASIEDFLRRARDDVRSWSVAGNSARWFPSAKVFHRRDTSASFAGDSTASEEKHNNVAERRPDLPEGATGDDNVIRLVHYRLPWLVTPDSAIHAMPTLSLRSGDAVRFEVMGGVIGGQSGVYGQLVLRF